MPQPVAFMVMPFNRKATGLVEAKVPAEVDFDALWDRVYAPVLTEAGYRPVRADQDVGALIITEMIQRLALADLVVADITLPNANVYYEIGVRHAAQSTGCVLVSASWARPVFDLAQMRQLRFPLDDGDVGDDAAAAARQTLRSEIAALAAGQSPVHASLPGFPGNIDETRVAAFQDVVNELAAFHQAAREVELRPEAPRRAAVHEIVARYGESPVVRRAVVMRIVRLLRDHVGWKELIDYIDTLPAAIARHPSIVEQKYMAIGKQSDAVEAAAGLENLIRLEGPTSERYGLLGGRYKQLAHDVQYDAAARRRFLDLAIESYENGMMADLNDYYPASNLPRLYRERAGDGDERRAANAQVITMAACERAIGRGIADEWVRPTLLGLAFDRHDVTTVRRLLADVEHDGAPAWQLDTTLADLRRATALCPDPETRSHLDAVLQRLGELVSEHSG
jgi:hypothetical protein